MILNAVPAQLGWEFCGVEMGSKTSFIRAPIVAIMIFQLAALFARAYLQTWLVESGESRPFAHGLSYLVVPLMLAVLLYPVLRDSAVFLLSLLRHQDLTLRLIAISVLLGITLRLSFWGGVISLVSFGILRSPDPTAVVGPDVFFACPGPGVLAMTLLTMSVLVPITEEVINRGLILQSLLHQGKTMAIILTSALFAIVHDPHSIIIAFIGGLFLAVHMINCATLWAPLITHATYNTLAVLDWVCLSIQWNPVHTTPAIMEMGLIATALAVVGMSFSVVLVLHKGHRGA